MSAFDWLELRVRPKKDGLHDSGYRFLSVVGVTEIDGKRERTQLNEWADNVRLYGVTQIDAEADGTLRLWMRPRPMVHDGWTGSDAHFMPLDPAEAVRYMTVFHRINAS